MEDKLETKVAKLKAALEHNSKVTVDALAAKDARLDALGLEAIRLKEMVQQQDQLLIALQKDLSATKSEVISIISNFKEHQPVSRILPAGTDRVSVMGTPIMPKSCADLWRIGHVLSGLYSVMGSTQVESVYCDFTKIPVESGNIRLKFTFNIQFEEHLSCLSY